MVHQFNAKLARKEFIFYLNGFSFYYLFIVEFYMVFFRALRAPEGLAEHG